MEGVIGYIYKITNPAGSIYIGQTRDIKSRVKFYSLSHCKRQTKLYRSILKYGWENHLFEILETIDFDKTTLDNLEKHYIIEFNSFNSKKGMNLTTGGDSPKHTDTNCEKFRKLRIGKKLSEATKDKLRKANLGKKQSIETITKRQPKLKGLKRSLETCKRISEARKGMKFSESHKQALRNAIRPQVSDTTRQKHKEYYLANPLPKPYGNNNNGKKVIDTSTNLVFESLVAACKHFGYNYSTIKQYLGGRFPNKTSLQWA